MTTRFRTHLTRRSFVSAGGLSAVVTILGATRPVNQAGAQQVDQSSELRVKTGAVRLRGPQHGATQIVGYGGVVPGPTLRVRRGEEIQARLVNDWTEPTLVHWHGLRIPNQMDGTPHLTQPLVVPGQSFDYRFVARDAGTFWYHAPAARQFERGLSGPVIVEEAEPVAVDRDILLMLDDWHLRGDGSLHENNSGSRSEQTVLTANGQSEPAIPVRRGDRVRLRLINATASRLLSVNVPHQPAWVMAIDGQPAEPFVARDSRVMIAPGNRLDLFVDILDGVDGTVPILIDNAAGPGGPVAVARLTLEGDTSPRPPRGDPKPLPSNPLPAQIDLRNALRVQAPLDPSMAGNPAPAPRKTVPTSKASADPSPASWLPLERLSTTLGSPAFSVKRGRPVTLTFANPGSQAHVIHVHGHTFRLLDNLDDGWKPFWLDTLLVAPQQTARIAFVADVPGKWAIERRSLADPTRESLIWFEVV